MIRLEGIENALLAAGPHLDFSPHREAAGALLSRAKADIDQALKELNVLRAKANVLEARLALRVAEEGAKS